MPTIDISVSELLDRLSILEVKRAYLKSDFQKEVVEEGIDLLQTAADEALRNISVKTLYQNLYVVNEAMWVAMEGLYRWQGPRNAQFEDIILQIVEVNKERAYIKREIDGLLGSKIREAKSFFKSETEA
jgi:hypothetical protein